METRWFESGGAKLRYQIAGDTGHPILFVHGLTCGLADWHHQVEHFSKQHIVLAVDLRGHGQSTPGREKLSIEIFGADVAALLDTLNLEQVLLVGHSMGCRVVIEAWGLRPSKIAGLVLIDGSKVAQGNIDTLEAEARAQVAEVGYENFHQRLFSPMFTSDSDSAMRADVLARCADVAEEVGMASYIGLMRWDATLMETRLANVDAPVLLIQSTRQHPQQGRISLKKGDTSEYLETVLGAASNARAEIIEDTGHFTMLERPGTVNALINDFIKSLHP